MDGGERDVEAEALLARVAAAAQARDAALDRTAEGVATRRARGVVHTPIAIARAIVRAADDAIVRDLGRARGLGHDDVVIVDPATGPGVFAATALAIAGSRRGAPRALIGLDVDARAIAGAEALLAPAARDAGWPLRLRACDALDTLAPVPELEDDDVVRVVIGNPPWAGRSANAGSRAAAALLDDFRRGEDGAPLRERKIGVLSDDYVRFLRWSCELVRRSARGGVIAMVTNASYLDGPVHRGVRGALARWLDRIDVIDLGGSALVARPGGDRDANLFGVRTGVAILIGVRGPGPPPRAARIAVRALRGSAGDKLAALEAWRPGGGSAPAPRGAWRVARAAPPGYASFPSLAEWMPFHREGLQTNRDELVIDRDRDALIARLREIARGRVRMRASAHFDPARARARAAALLDDPAALARAIRPIAYRPLDPRFALVDPALCHRPRPALARAIDASGLALITTRKDRGRKPWLHFGASALLPDNCWLSTRSSCRARAFPLRDPAGALNLAPHLSTIPIDPERFVAWAIAWLASESYQRACEPALQLDFPRIPAPRDEGELARVVTAGRALIAALAGTAGTASGDRAARASIGHHPALSCPALTRAIAAAEDVVAPIARELLGA